MPRRRARVLAAGLVVAALVAGVLVAVNAARGAPSGAKWPGAADRPVSASDGGSAGWESSPQMVSVFDLRPGTCLAWFVEEARAREVPVVPCAAEHAAEVVAAAEMPDGGWPGPGSVDAFAAGHCVPAIRDLGIELAEPLRWSYYGPSEDSWVGTGDRKVSCLVVSEAAALTGSLVGSTADRFGGEE